MFQQTRFLIFKFGLLALAAAPLVLADTVPVEADELGPWRQLATPDLNFVHKTLQENHPGVRDHFNKKFGQWLEEGHRQGSASLSSVDSFADLRYLLQRYGSGFNDRHLYISTKFEDQYRYWPELVLSKVGSKYIVNSDRDPWQGFDGSELMSCDQVDVKSLIKKNVFPYHYGNTQLDGDWHRLVPKLLVDFGNPWVSRPKRCLLKSQKGQRQTIELDWQRIDTQTLDAMLEDAAFGAAPVAGISESRSLVWVSLPSFNTTRIESEVLKRIVEQISNYRNANVIVFDVRGNNGGNSQWGADLISKLYGPNFTKAIYAKADSTSSQVDWRISPGNSAYLTKLTPAIATEFGSKSSILASFKGVAELMTAAVSRGETGLMRQPAQNTGAPTPEGALAASPVSANVFFLTDGRCASACLDFADRLLEFPNVTHIGLPTGADTVYMEVRSVDLPSGLMRMSFAMKVYRNRTRGHNQFYTPEIPYSGPMGDTQKLKTWVTKLARRHAKDSNR